MYEDDDDDDDDFVKRERLRERELPGFCLIGSCIRDMELDREKR